MAPKAKIAVITVFHNSELFFDRYVEALQHQSVSPDLVILIDSGSADPSYLQRMQRSSLPYRLELRENIGFCKGNNRGYELVDDADYIFFLNPDAFPEPDFLGRAIHILQTADPRAAAISGALLGFDIVAGTPTGILDSTGIFRSGLRLVDRDQGKDEGVLAAYPPLMQVDALCGAAMLCNRTALDAVSVNGMIFDEAFFAYKEDIDLSWRLRHAGWHLLLAPTLHIYHCRGWKAREQVPTSLRLLSACNEIRLYSKHPSPFFLVALAKYFLVRCFNY